MSDDQQIDEIRDDIEQTRADMSQTIDQLEARLSPDALQEQASEIINRLSDQLLSEFQTKSDEISGKISEQMQTAVNSAATQKIDQFIEQAGSTARTAGATLWSRFANNPAPVALAAVGIGLLAAEGGAAKEQVSHLAQGMSDRMQHGGGQGSGQERGQGLLESAKQMVGEQVSGVKEQLSHATTDVEAALHGVTEQAGDTLHGAVDQAKSQGEHLKESASGMMPGSGSGNGASMSGQGSQGGMLSGMLENPGFATGLLALGLGLVAGLGVPETQKEKELVAPLRERAMDQLDAMGITDTTGQGGGLIEQVKESGSQMLDEAKQTGGEMLDEAKATARQTGEQLKESAEAVKQDAQDATGQARQSATSKT
jgi:F0F1-type ATP synthase membrane subunit b/b'